MRAKRPGESALLLLDVVDALAGAGVDYAVIGAMAASVHGSVRASMDADAVLSAGPLEIDRLRQALERTGLHVEVTRGDLDDPIAALLRVHDAHGNRVDLLAGLRGMDSGTFSRVVHIPFQRSMLSVVGREDFIAMKAFSGGPIDLQDAANVVEVAGEALDRDLLRRVAAGYGRDAAGIVEKLLGAGL